MSKVFQLEQTSVKDQFCNDLRQLYGMSWIPERTCDVYRIIITSIVDCLKQHRSKNTPRIGFSIKDVKGNFKLGAILGYKKPEEDSEEDSGNWFLQMTFDESDMDNLDVSDDNHSDIFYTLLNHHCDKVMSGRFSDFESAYNVTVTAIDEIIKFLDINADPNEEVEISIRGIFTASVAIEKDEKVMSIVPGEFIKQLIKDDSSL